MIRFFTNLDLAQPYVRELSKKWLSPMPPRVGEEIVFALHERRTFSLAVVAVRYDETGEPTVELHLGKTAPGQSIHEWEEWFKRHTGHMRLQ